MNKWNKEELKDVILHAGSMGMNYFRKTDWSLKSDGSLLTEADLAVEKYFASIFDKPEENVFMIGEESVQSKDEDYIRHALKERAWIVDPIDGTAPFAHHVPIWGVLVAYMEQGMIKEGAVLLPCTGELLLSDSGKVFASDAEDRKTFPALTQFRDPGIPRVEGGIISVAQNVVRDAKVVVKNPLHAICCSAFSGTYLAKGRYLAYLGCTKLWDIAAMLPIFWNLSYKTRLLDGTPIDSNVSDFFILPPESNDRWYLKNHIVVAKTDEIADYATSSCFFQA